MLKYAALILVCLAGYVMWGRSKPVAAVPRLPVTRVFSTTSATAKRNVSAAVAKTSVPAPALATPEPTDGYSYPEIQRLIVNNDVCALNKLVHELALKGEAPIYIDAFLEATNLRGLKEIIGVNGPIFKSQEGNQLQSAAKFIDSIALTDLAYGMKQDKQDPERALRQLEELVREHPENGAYITYKLALENQMGKTKSQIRESAKALSGATVFNSVISDVRHQLTQHAWDSAAINLLSRAVLMELPNLRIHKASDVLESIDDSKGVEKLGELMVKGGLESKRSYHSREFDTTEYYFGNTLLHDRHPTIVELAEQREPGKTEEIDEATISYELEVDGCDPSSFEEHFAKLRGKF